MSATFIDKMDLVVRSQEYTLTILREIYPPRDDEFGVLLKNAEHLLNAFVKYRNRIARPLPSEHTERHGHGRVVWKSEEMAKKYQRYKSTNENDYLTNYSKPPQEVVRVVTVPNPKSRTLIDRPPPDPFVTYVTQKSIPGSRSDGVPRANQDRMFVVNEGPLFIAGVFDGHGEAGQWVSDYVSNIMKQLVVGTFGNCKSLLTEREILTKMRSVFLDVEKELSNSSGLNLGHSGTTASLVLRCGADVYCAYLGDSKVCGIEVIDGVASHVMETSEHKPSNPEESERIRKSGGTVTEMYYDHLKKSISRIANVGISVSRAYGDTHARAFGLISAPEFVKFELPKFRNGTLCLVIATDGVWDTVSSSEIVGFLKDGPIQDQSKLESSVEEITAAAWTRRMSAEGRADDTTAVVALFKRTGF